MDERNPVLLRILEGDYEGGWELYTQLSAPGAQDDRWAGLCLHNLGRMFEAKTLLAKAVSRGEAAARIELATLYRLAGQPEIASSTLADLMKLPLEPFDAALAYREASSQALSEGDLGKATSLLERAWFEGQGTWAGDKLLVSIAQVMGTVYALRGLDARAIEYFEFATRSANPARRAFVLGARGLSLVYLGQYDEAEEALRSAAAHARHFPFSQPVLTYNRGVLERARGALQGAQKLFAEAAALAKQAGENETECYAELALCAVATATGEFQVARRHLARGRNLTSGPRGEGFALLREGALLALQGQPTASDVLHRAQQIFTQLRLDRELGWTWLHLAEAHLRLGNITAADEALAEATDLRHALGSGQAFVIESRSLPQVQAHLGNRAAEEYGQELLTDLAAAEGAVPRTVRLETLGGARLLMDGKPVRLDLARSVEILTFLLDRPDSRLDQMQITLFPDAEHKRSKSYIHQARSELERSIPGLKIPYNRERRTYSVVLDGLQLEWDLLQLRHALNDSSNPDFLGKLDLYTGPLLWPLDGEWIETEREALKSWIIQLGLETLDEWHAQGEHEKCLHLATRLLGTDPLDEALNEFLLKATLVLKGHAAARAAHKRICELYENEYGDVPATVAKFSRQLNQSLN
ncbi:hypothetical protein K7W42_17685 [Deinococcus sp. HMF7604]|uniref:BTAD domain-containing putative transcriptional regulator n=1 Tax=Deinococcus betulae TaxID=2873312 RepID=UPI001CCA9894|nr:BTAD domain-containing putative transcriptional regulator [Deinococcus betulae]MBZ9752677.1 hypothetical protein [Deinococcus betulae]